MRRPAPFYLFALALTACERATVPGKRQFGKEHKVRSAARCFLGHTGMRRERLGELPGLGSIWATAKPSGVAFIIF